jgi:cytochrome c peroxidase
MSMRLLSRRALAATLLACLCVLSHSAPPASAAPGVPALPSTSANYVGYAVTNLPNYFKTGQLAAFNNTPVDNPISNAGATLGRVLFYDQRVSHDNGTACASCHQQEFSFDDPNQKSEGFEGGLTGRHSTPLANAAYYDNGRAFWDERAASLEEQALMPIQDPVEMGTNLDQLRGELAATDFYPQLFQDAFGSSEITNDKISKALAQFVRSMASYQSKFDQALAAGTPGSPGFNSVLTPQEARGHQVFTTTGLCSQCHVSQAQIGTEPHNIGLDADNSADAGAGDGRFKTMSLRNVAVRERFMHDGRFTTLEEVIEFYNSGVQSNPDLDFRLKDGNGNPRQLNLSEDDKAALVAFLGTLTDTAFLTSDLFSNPFVALPGDYDGDGLVNDDDYAVWAAEYGSTTSLETSSLLADGNGDGAVDTADYTVWRDNYGASWEDFLYSISTAVPEPTAGALLLLSLLLTPLRRATNQPH